jgi:hypothetical protein
LLFVRYGFAMPFECLRLLPFALLLAAALFCSAGRFRAMSVGIASAVISLAFLLFLSPSRLEARRDIKATKTPSLTFLQGQLGKGSFNGRLLSTQGALMPDTMAAFGVAQFNGLNPVQIQTTATFVLHALSDKHLNYTLPVAWQGLVEAPDYISWSDYVASRETFNLLNVKYLVDQINGPLSSMKIDSLEEVFRGDGMQIWRDTRALPRAFLVSAGIHFVNTLEEAQQSVSEQRKQNDFHLIVESAKVLELKDNLASSRFKAESDVVVVRYTANEVVLDANPSRPSMLVLSDAFFPGWIATVDSEKADILRVESLVRGLMLRPGKHRVIFTYAPSYLGALLWLSGGGWATAAFLFLSGVSWRTLFTQSIPADGI